MLALIVLGSPRHSCMHGHPVVAFTSVPRLSSRLPAACRACREELRESLYTCNTLSMMRTVYDCMFFTATKVPASTRATSSSTTFTSMTLLFLSLSHPVSHGPCHAIRPSLLLPHEQADAPQ